MDIGLTELNRGNGRTGGWPVIGGNRRRRKRKRVRGCIGYGGGALRVVGQRDAGVIEAAIAIDNEFAVDRTGDLGQWSTESDRMTDRLVICQRERGGSAVAAADRTGHCVGMAAVIAQRVDRQAHLIGGDIADRRRGRSVSLHCKAGASDWAERRDDRPTARRGRANRSLDIALTTLNVVEVGT